MLKPYKQTITLLIAASLIGGFWHIFTQSFNRSDSIENHIDEQSREVDEAKSLATVNKKVIDQNQCVDLLQNYDSPDIQKKLKFNQLQAFYLSLPNEAKSPKQLAKFAAYTGIDVSDLDLSRKDRKFSPDERLKQPSNIKILSFKSGAHVVNWLKSKDIHSLIQAVNTSTIDANSHLGYQSLLSLTLHYIPELAGAELMALIESGVEVRLPDLIESSKSRYPSYVREILLQHATFDVSEIWFDGTRFNSLATVAITQFNLDALMFWHQAGAPLYHAEYYFNGLDLLSTPNTAAQKEQGLSILNYLLAQTLPPVTTQTEERLVKWYGQAEALDIQAEPIAFESIQMQTVADELKALVASTNENIEQANKLKEQCIAQYESYQPIMNIREQQLLAKNKVSQIDMFNTAAERQEKLLASYEKLALHLNEMEMDKTGDIIAAATNKQWDKAIQAAQELSDSSDKIDHEMLELLMMQALSGGAPLSVIDSLLAKGAELPKDAIHILALHDQLALTKALLSYGIDLHAADAQGRNALSYCMMSIAGKEMFNFLLSSNVTIKPSGKGLDPLDYALKASEFKPEAVDFALKLIELGAPIEQSHRQQLQLLEFVNKTNYLRLVPVFN